MDASATISLGGIMKRTILVIVCTLMGYGCASKKVMKNCDFVLEMAGDKFYECDKN